MEVAKQEAAEGDIDLSDPAADIDRRGDLAVLADWERGGHGDQTGTARGDRD